MSATIEPVLPTQNLTGNFSDHSVKLRRISVAEYDQMIGSGVFDENDPIELINGVIIEKMPKGTRHSSANDRVTRIFYKTFGDDVIIRNQNPIWLDDFSEPEPDIVLAAPRKDEYENSHPTPREIYLILEVSDSTLGYDRTTKGEAYARAGIRQYLVLNIQEGTLEDYREPSAGGFQSKQTLRAGKTFNLVAFPEISFNVTDFLPTEK